VQFDLQKPGTNAMTEGYAVKAKNPQGIVVTLRRGFASKQEAEDHRVTMSQWKRVWVEQVETAEKNEI